MNSDTLILFIPILSIAMGLGIPMLAIFLNYRKRKEMFALYHLERMAAIEKGIELPPLPQDFFQEDAGRPRRRSQHGTFLVGLILVFVGLTLYIARHFTLTQADTGGNPALFALVPGGIGVAFLIYYFTVGRKLALEAEQKDRLAAEASQSQETLRKT